MLVDCVKKWYFIGGILLKLMYVIGKFVLSCCFFVIYWMKFFLFFISRGVYINVFVFRYDLGEILIIMNDKKKRIVKL